MSLNMQIVGVREALAAFEEVPRRVRLKHVRIGLSKAGGILRDTTAILAPRDTGLLSKNLKVKVKVPDASFNIKHHGKPAYAVIGAGRIRSPYRRRTSEGRLIGFGEANRLFRRELRSGAKLRAARLTVEERFRNAVYRSPSRYAHIVEKGRRAGRRGGRVRGTEFHKRAVGVAGHRATVAGMEKMRLGLLEEAAKAYAKRGVP